MATSNSQAERSGGRKPAQQRKAPRSAPKRPKASDLPDGPNGGDTIKRLGQLKSDVATLGLLTRSTLRAFAVLERARLLHDTRADSDSVRMLRAIERMARGELDGVIWFMSNGHAKHLNEPDQQDALDAWRARGPRKSEAGKRRSPKWERLARLHEQYGLGRTAGTALKRQWERHK